MNLNSKQVKSLSEFFNSLAVAWLTGGVISPLFTNPESQQIANLYSTLGISASAFFLLISLILLKKKEKI
ncbi:MAG: hypothetical protein ACD_19C00426G0079 [uncultured bacterium]|nr:MAG: hypothetical protein ACD_19C00426G0079 [uncultured bacterium]